MEFIPPLPSNIPKMVAGWCLLAGVFHPRCLTNQWGTPKLGFDTICFLIFSRWATNFVSLPTPAPPKQKKEENVDRPLLFSPFWCWRSSAFIGRWVSCAPCRRKWRLWICRSVCLFWSSCSLPWAPLPLGRHDNSCRVTEKGRCFLWHKHLEKDAANHWISV